MSIYLESTTLDTETTLNNSINSKKEPPYVGWPYFQSDKSGLSLKVELPSVANIPI